MSEVRRSSSGQLAAIEIPATLDDVLRELRAVRMIVDQHVLHCQEEFARSKLRHEALMTMVGRMIAP